MGHISPWGHTSKSYLAMAVKLSYTTVVTRSLRRVSGASLAVDGSFPSCAVLGYRLMFTIIINIIATFKKDIIIEYKLDHNYCFLKLRIHGLHVSK